MNEKLATQRHWLLDILSSTGHSKICPDLTGQKAGYLSAKDNTEAIRVYFSEPEAEPFGWESSAHTQERNAVAFKRINEAVPTDKNILIFGHGDGGTTLLCSLLNTPISRERDQPTPGCYWVYDRETRAVSQTWTPYSTILTTYSDS